MTRAAAAIVAAACFSSAVIALSWAWADLSVRSVLESAAANGSAGANPSPVATRLHQASSLDPLNADYRAELARHYAWLGWRTQGIEEVSIPYRNLSSEYYREAIRLRPTWGFAWINLAESELLAGRRYAAMRHALNRAIQLAPWEPDTHLKILLIGFSSWKKLSEDERNEVRVILRRAIELNNHVDQVIRLAVQTGLTAELEGLLEQKRHLEIYKRITSSTEISLNPAGRLTSLLSAWSS